MKLDIITKDTCIGSEFLGIYNLNNERIESSFNNVEDEINSLRTENKKLRERLSQLSGNYQTLKNSYDTLNYSYQELMSVFGIINEKLDDIINKE